MNTKEKFYKESWISTAVLCVPEIINGKLSKGVLILNQVDPLVDRNPMLKRIFYIVERHGWFGPNEATQADIMLVEDQSMAEIVKLSSPNAVHLDLGPADFIDTESFTPINGGEIYDVIQISCWSQRKRIELFIEAAAQLPELKFLHMGHFENNGSNEELIYREKCLKFAKKIAPNIHFPFFNCNHNDGFPNTKKEVNGWINKAKIGVLTTMSEGINRFKMECLSANKPCLVPADVAWTTRKHINEQTGSLFNPNVSDLVKEIKRVISHIDDYNPRDYILQNTGKMNSLAKLKQALHKICLRSGAPYRYDFIDWDGRNESLIWGIPASELLSSLVEKYSPYLDDQSCVVEEAFV